MPIVNMLEAKTQLSRLVESVELGEEIEVVIARNGRPAARLVPMPKERPKRLGLQAGKFAHMSLEKLNASNEEIAALFNGSDQ